MTIDYEALGLSPEEIAALAEDEDVTTDQEDDPNPDDIEDDAGDDAPEEEEPDDTPADDLSPEPDPEPAPEEPAPTPPEPKPEPAPEPQTTQPSASVTRITEIESSLAELKATRAAEKQKYDEGEYSADEWEDIKDGLFEQMSDLKAERAKIEAKEELRAEQAATTWQTSQNIFLSANPYLREDPDLFEFFAMQVNKIGATPEGQRMSDEQLLSAAKVRVDAIVGRKADPEPSPKKEESPVRKAKREAAKVQPPTTLSGVPAAKEADVGQDEFAYLDRLSGERFEAAIAKLTPDQRNRWAHAQ